jgi:hypothetical protein
MLALVACSALLVAGLDAPPVVDARQAYQEAKAKATRSPEDQVRLALWCEAHGLTTERLHHLTLAILADPGNATARGLMGLVLREGRWQRPEAIADKLRPMPTTPRPWPSTRRSGRRPPTTPTPSGRWGSGLMSTA